MATATLSGAGFLPPAISLLLACALHAQGPGEQTGVETPGVVVAPEAPFTGYTPDVPMPPKVLFGTLSGHVDPPIPIGPYRSAPNTPESQVVDPARVDAGSFRYFQLENVSPSGQSTSVVGEPSVAQTDHVVFQTGNWYAARSTDNGASWTHVSPYTFFGSRDGGFCCDQRLLYVPSQDITIWVMQYSYSSSTQMGGYRIAVANGDVDLANPNPSAWTTWYFTPNTIGLGLQRWFDFPDVAASDGNFFLSCNVYDHLDNYQDTVIFRISLAQLQSGSGIALNNLRNSTAGINFSPRMAKGGASTDRIYWAAIVDTSNLQIGYYTDAGTYSRVTRAVSTFSTTISSTPSPDGVNWAARAPSRFRGAYGNGSEVGFLFTSGPVTGRAQPFLRVFRFTADSARTLLGQHDIWSSSTAFTYGAASSNSQGDVGLAMAYGSASTYVQSGATIIDSYQPWGGLTIYSMGGGQDSPNQPRWGDYFEVRQHSDFGRTFVGTGMRQIGGSANSNNTPQFAWFGRDDYEPTWVNVTVQSAGVTSGVAITMDVTDMDGNSNGTTTFTRRLTPLQPYALTAPATVVSGSTTWAFERWRYQVQPGTSWNNGAIGERVLSFSTVGNFDDVCEAVYKVRRTLTIRSTNPTSGVAITVSPDDISGNNNGTTTFARYYRDGEVVTLTAPAALGFDPFKYWRVGGTPQAAGQVTIQVTMNSSRTVYADYWTNVAGSVTSIGAGCVGSNGLVPSHTATWPAGQQGPQQGTPTTYRLANARPRAGVAMNFGISTRSFGPFPLPLDLGIIGITGCNLYHDLVVSESMATDAAGTVRFPITWPVDPAAVGGSVFTSFVIVDPGVRRPTPLTLSNALETVQGGNR